MTFKEKVKFRAKAMRNPLLAVAAMGLLFSWASTASFQNPPVERAGDEQAEKSGGPEGKGTDSQRAKGRKQRKPVAAPAKGIPMRPANQIKESDKKPATELDTELERKFKAKLRQPDMAAELAEREKKGHPPVRGELPSFEEAQRIQPQERPERPRPRERAAKEEEAEQAQQQARVARGKKHLRIVIRLKEDGSHEVLSATEFEGGAIFSEVPSSDYIYEVTEGGKTIAAEALAGDPFEIHSFGALEDRERGHYIETAKEATIVVRVPGVTLESALDRIEVTLHKLEKGPPLEKVNAAVLAKLKKENRVRTVLRVRGRELAAGIRSKGVRRER